MPTFLFKDSEGNVQAQVSAPPDGFVYTGAGRVASTTVQVGDSVRIGGGSYRKVDEIIPDEV